MPSFSLTSTPARLATLATCALLALSPAALAGSGSKTHGHAHAHAEEDKARAIYDGYFEDDEIRPRDLSDWAGDWQSVFPLLRDGTLDPIMAHKAESGDRTAEEYKTYYMTGYETDVDRILIDGNSVTFFGPDGPVQGQYENDGYEILTYKKGNRGVRYIFAKSGGDDAAPAFIQFSDHAIAPVAADHYHLYWGEDRAEVLKELTNWPTYYPAALTGAEVVREMTAH